MPARQRWCGGSRGDVAAVEADLAGIGREAAGDQVEQRRLAGAVRPDDAERLARRDRTDRYRRRRTDPKLASLDLQTCA